MTCALASLEVLWVCCRARARTAMHGSVARDGQGEWPSEYGLFPRIGLT